MNASVAQRRFDGRVVVVTGAGSGIGQATAVAFASEGAIVYGIDVDHQGLERSGRAITVDGGLFSAITADVSRPEEVVDSISRIVGDRGRVDTLVNNAGINMAKRLEDLDISDWDRVFDINLRSVYLFCKEVWPHFVSRNSGAIVNVASVMGQVGGVGSPAYCSAKAGIIMLTRCLAKDGARHGIRANCVCPGYIDTPIMERALQETPDPRSARRDIEYRMPLGRMGSAKEVASGILFLTSVDASYISGTELTIDGAVTATQID